MQSGRLAHLSDRGAPTHPRAPATQARRTMARARPRSRPAVSGSTSGRRETCPLLDRGWRYSGQSEQLALRGDRARRDEATGIQAQLARAVEPMLAAGDMETLAQQVGKHALAMHAGGKVAVVVATLVHLLHQAHHMPGAL